MAIDAPMRKRSEPVTALYDSACELLFAAQELKQAAGDRRATAAIPATIGCMDATLAALADAVADMRRAASAELAQIDSPGVVERELAALAEALAVAQAACDAARERSGPILAQLTLS